MTRRSPPRKVTYFESVPPPLARNTIIESTFEVGRRFRCTMRVAAVTRDRLAQSLVRQGAPYRRYGPQSRSYAADVERGHPGAVMICRESSSLPTRRWREMDSNLRFPNRSAPLLIKQSRFP
jgi:hypothetical protein